MSDANRPSPDPLGDDGAERSDPADLAPYSRHGTPAPLAVAAGLTLVQGVLTVAFGIGEVADLDPDRLVMGTTTGLFFLAYGAGLVLCAWGLHTVRSWARGPVLLAQLIWLGLAWSFRGGETTVVSVVLLVVAAIVLAGLLHPRSIEALERAAGR